MIPMLPKLILEYLLDLQWCFPRPEGAGDTADPHRVCNRRFSIDVVSDFGNRIGHRHGQNTKREKKCGEFEMHDFTNVDLSMTVTCCS